MNSPYSFPEILNLAVIDISTIIDKLYSIFENDFKINKTFHDGIIVEYNKTIKADGAGKEEGFWHVISRDDYISNERLIDYRRAERLPWAKPMIENFKIPEIKYFDYDHGSKDAGIRRYIWLENYDYVLVLQKKKKEYFWITAYYVDKKQKDKLSKKYDDRVINDSDRS